MEDIRGYIHYKIESIGDFEIQKDLEKMCNNDLSLKSEHRYLECLSLVKHMFYTYFNNNDWTRIILSRVHDDLLWLGDSIISIDNDLIHKVTRLSNQGSNPVNIKNVRKILKQISTHIISMEGT